MVSFVFYFFFCKQKTAYDMRISYWSQTGSLPIVSHWLVIRDPGASNDGLFARDAQYRELCAVRDAAGEPRLAPAQATGIAPLVVGEYILADGRRPVPAFQLLAEIGRAHV